MIPGFDFVHKLMGAKFTFRLYNPFWSFIGIKPKPIILDEETKENIRVKVAGDINEFCSLFSLDRSNWNYFFKQ
jgi:hypothetical protein